MTPKELYEWAKERRLEDASIRVDTTRDIDEFELSYPEIKDVGEGRYEVVINID